jgi:predicted glycosyltransferase
MDYKRELQKALDYLRQQRDEINVKLHLGQKDLQDEMQVLEKQWQDFRQRSEHVLETADESAEDVSQALKLLGEEIKAGFEKIRKAL